MGRATEGCRVSVDEWPLGGNAVDHEEVLVWVGGPRYSARWNEGQAAWNDMTVEKGGGEGRGRQVK